MIILFRSSTCKIVKLDPITPYRFTFQNRMHGSFYVSCTKVSSIPITTKATGTSIECTFRLAVAHMNEQSNRSDLIVSLAKLLIKSSARVTAYQLIRPISKPAVSCYFFPFVPRIRALNASRFADPRPGLKPNAVARDGSLEFMRQTERRERGQL